MSTAVLITLCLLLLLAYVFDLSSSKTKIPSVILLISLGWGVSQLATALRLPIPSLSSVLPILGTVGLILIVLEGSLELELNPSKKSIISKSTALAVAQLLLTSFGLAYAFSSFGGCTFKDGLMNAIPLSVISSAIAIPSVRNLKARHREFITYESSLSDIFGVVFFNFLVLNESIDFGAFGGFVLELIVMILVSFVSTLGLAYLLSKIKHHIKFTPIILLVILIYSLSKVFHLPSLIFILIFGLFMGNLHQLKGFRGISNFNPEPLNIEIQKFKEITAEITFMIRSLFFLLFGFLINSSDLINLQNAQWAAWITSGIFIVRAVLLASVKLPLNPLLYVAPRGLITILLFLSLPAGHQISMVNQSLILQVIVLTALVMMLGLMQNRSPQKPLIPREGP
ncbi:MAG: sodium:proton antiporter [Bacteroidia bacterium]